MSRFYTVLTGLTLFLSAAVGTGTAEEKKSAAKADTVLLGSNYWELYPHQEAVSIRTFKQIADPPGVLLSLRTTVKDFSHYLYSFQKDSLKAEPAREGRDGEIAVHFQRRNEPKPQLITTTIQVVSKSGEKTRPYRVVIGYYPKELYAAGGQTSQSWLVVQNTDLVIAKSGVEDWVLEELTAADRAYAEKRWGEAVKGHSTDYEKAQAVAREIMKVLRTHRGVPSDTMLASSGFEQLKRAESGKDRVWCSNYADIFSQACNSLGIPARRIGMQYYWSTEGDTNLEIAEGHSTTEIFDGQRNRWVWIDLTFDVLGMYLSSGEPINMAELVQHLNDGNRIAGLKVKEFNPETGAEQTVPVLESSKKDALLHYFRQDQQYRYVRKASAKPSSSGTLP